MQQQYSAPWPHGAAPPPSPPQQYQQYSQGWGYGIPFQRRPHETVSVARQLVAAVRSGTAQSFSMQPPPPSQQQYPQEWMYAPQPEPEPEPAGDYVDFRQGAGTANYEPLVRTESPPGAVNYLGARRDLPLLPTISRLQQQMAVTLGAEMGAGAEAGVERAAVDTYEAKRTAIMRSMSVAPAEPTEGEEQRVVAWEWKDMVQVAKYNNRGVRVGSQQQYLVCLSLSLSPSLPLSLSLFLSHTHTVCVCACVRAGGRRRTGGRHAALLLPQRRGLRRFSPAY